MEPDFRTIRPDLHNMALRAWNIGDVGAVLCLMDNTSNLAFVMDNIAGLKKMGKYEDALFNSYINTRVNFSEYSFLDIQYLFHIADPEKLCAAGDPIPAQDNFTLYRGVAGNTSKRRVNGYSWTESPNTAAWFAMRFVTLDDPAVFKVTVPRESILARCKDRNESEYLLRLPVQPVRVLPIPEAYRPK